MQNGVVLIGYLDVQNREILKLEDGKYVFYFS
jgi:hypothetical protein